MTPNQRESFSWRVNDIRMRTMTMETGETKVAPGMTSEVIKQIKKNRFMWTKPSLRWDTS